MARILSLITYLLFIFLFLFLPFLSVISSDAIVDPNLGKPAPTTTTTPPPTAAPTTTSSGSGISVQQGVALEDAVGFKACNVSASNAAQSGKLQECVGAVLRFALVIAGVVAIVRLAVAAFDFYNPETGNNVVKDSIESIRNIFIGLMLIAGGVMILNTFNVALIDFSFLGFTASKGGSSNTSTAGTNGSSTGSNATTAADQKFGNIALSSTDPKANIQTLQQAINDLKTGKITQADFEKALKYTLDNVNLKTLTQTDVSSITGLFNSLKSANINFTPDPNLLAALNGSGNNADGSQQKPTASYCSIDPCTIQGASAVGNPQILTVTMINKNNTPVNYLIRLNPPNQLPSPLDQYLKLKAGATATSAQFDVIKNSISGTDFANWCSIANATSGGGGTACYNSPATTTDYLYNSPVIV